MNKSTHKGTCQVCNAIQKIQNNGSNSVFTHGFTKREGWWMNDECYGSSHQALEVSCNMVKESIARASVSRKHLEADLLAQFEETAPIKTTLRWYERGHGSVSVKAECTKLEKLKVKNSTYDFIKISWLGEDGKTYDFEEYGTVDEFEQHHREMEVIKLKRQVADVTAYIEQQQHVLDNWVAKPLTKI